MYDFSASSFLQYFYYWQVNLRRLVFIFLIATTPQMDYVACGILIFLQLASMLYVSILRPFLSKVRNAAVMVNETGLFILYGLGWQWANGYADQGKSKFELYGLIFCITLIVILVIQLILIIINSFSHIRKLGQLFKKKREVEDEDVYNQLDLSADGDSSNSSLTAKSVELSEKAEDKGDRLEFGSDEFEEEIKKIDEKKKKIDAEKEEKERIANRKANFKAKPRPESPRKGKSLKSKYAKKYGDVTKAKAKIVTPES